MNEQPTTAPLLLEDLRETARRAFYWTSQDPDGRGDRTISGYSQELAGDLEYIAACAQTDEARAAVPATQAAYASRYRQLLSRWLHSHSNVASAFVTGPANFPTARNQKRSNWADGHFKTFIEWRDKARAAIARHGRPLITPATELEKAQANLAEREQLQEQMKAINKLVTSKDPRAALQAYRTPGGNALPEAKINQLLTPDYLKRVGFPSYALSNNNAEIRRLRARVDQLGAKMEQAAAHDGGSKVIRVDSAACTVTLNYQDDRLQLAYDEKPVEALRMLLKESGFNWAPSVPAWQRKITPQAIYKAARILGLPASDLQ